MADAATTAIAVAEPQRPRPALVAGNSPRAIVPTDFDGAWRIGNAVCEAGMAPRGLETPAKCTIAILQGLEVGLPPMQALQSISVINNRPSLWGDGALGLIQASGQLDDQDEHFEGQPGTDNFKAVCVLKRKGKERPYRGEFTVAQSKTAGLWTKRGRNGEPTPWQTYPDRMLKMRARAFAMRDGFSDILKGLGVAEEQEDVVRAAAPEQHQQEEGPPAPANDDASPPVPAEEATSGEVVEEGAFTEAGPPEPSDLEGPADPTFTHTNVSEGKICGTTVSHKPSDDLGIPDYLRRTPESKPSAPAISAEEQEWLDQLESEFGACSTMEELSEAARGQMAPWEGSVPSATWTLACEIQDRHVERIQAAR